MQAGGELVVRDSVNEPVRGEDGDESGWASDYVRAAAADKAEVDATVKAMRDGFERWEALIDTMASEVFEADLGDIYAACNADGQLQEFGLSADVMSSYTYIELQARINAVLEELRKLVIAEFEANGGGYVE